MPYSRTRVRPSSRSALADVTHAPFWLDRPERPDPTACLVADTTADLVIVGGGYTGMWTALLAKEADPRTRRRSSSRETAIAEGASGRNGGFMAASVTHGFSNGMSRWPDEMVELTRQGRANLDAIEATIARYGMDVDFARTGELDVATEDHHVAELAELPGLVAPYGEHLEFLDGTATRVMVDSPLYRGSVLNRDGVALVDPAKAELELSRVVRSWASGFTSTRRSSG